MEKYRDQSREGSRRRWAARLVAGVFAACVLSAGSLALAQTGEGYDLTWWTVDGGGRTGISGGDYTLLSTAGQPDARDGITGGDFLLYSGFWYGSPLNAGTELYLPVVIQQAVVANTPDLTGAFSLSPVRTSFTAGEPVAITVAVTNTGTAKAGAFWVDLYVNPSVAPAVNVPWYDACGLSPCYGIAWYVPGGLAVGDSVTLTSAEGSYSGAHTIWPGYFAAGTTALYVLVDSWNPDVSTGGVAESNESNNLSQRTGLAVSGESVSDDSLPKLDDIPARPAP